MFNGYMRATVFAPKRAKYPAYVQPKHNGIRCLWDGYVAWTREGNRHAPHIQVMLAETKRPFYRCGWVWDGELVLPRKRFSFQQTQSAVAAENENSHWLHFQTFDAHDGRVGGPVFSERMAYMLGFSTPTYRVENLEEVQYWYDTFLEQRYEGLIFRTDTPYRFGSAARHLMKKKPVDSAEFIIIGVWQGTGKNVGVPVYRLARPDVPYVKGAPATAKNSFGAVPKGNYDEKRALWAQHGDGSCIGKLYTVEFADRYDSGVPQFPIGIGVRDYE